MSLITVGVAHSFALSIPVGINMQPLIGNCEIATPYFISQLKKNKKRKRISSTIKWKWTHSNCNFILHISHRLSAKNSTCLLDWCRDIWQNRLWRLSPTKIDWLINWFVCRRVFYAISAIFQPYNGLTIHRTDSLRNYTIF